MAEERLQDASVEDIVEEAFVDSMSEHYTQRNTRHRVLMGLLQFIVLASLMTVVGFVAYKDFPDFYDKFEEWAEKANESGPFGKLLFTVAMSLLMLIPGVPGSVLCFTCGAVFPFWSGLVVAVLGQHWGSCLSFFIARRILSSHFKGIVMKRPTLQAFSAAARVEQWKVTFLSRFVVMPVQLKNYGFGVLPVSFKCFYIMSLLGDLQGIVFGVYLGSISKRIAASAKDTAPRSSSGDTLTAVNLVIAIFMTSTASYVARKAYLRMLEEANAEASRGAPAEVEELEALMPRKAQSSRQRKRFTGGTGVDGLELVVVDSTTNSGKTGSSSP